LNVCFPLCQRDTRHQAHKTYNQTHPLHSFLLLLDIALLNIALDDRD
jgi:hypothetical protein